MHPHGRRAYLLLEARAARAAHAAAAYHSVGRACASAIDLWQQPAPLAAGLQLGLLPIARALFAVGLRLSRARASRRLLEYCWSSPLADLRLDGPSSRGPARPPCGRMRARRILEPSTSHGDSPSLLLGSCVRARDLPAHDSAPAARRLSTALREPVFSVCGPSWASSPPLLPLTAPPPTGSPDPSLALRTPSQPCAARPAPRGDGLRPPRAPSPNFVVLHRAPNFVVPHRAPPPLLYSAPRSTAPRRHGGALRTHHSLLYTAAICVGRSLLSLVAAPSRVPSCLAHASSCLQSRPRGAGAAPWRGGGSPWPKSAVPAAARSPLPPRRSPDRSRGLPRGNGPGACLRPPPRLLPPTSSLLLLSSLSSCSSVSCTRMSCRMALGTSCVSE